MTQGWHTDAPGHHYASAGDLELDVTEHAQGARAYLTINGTIVLSDLFPDVDTAKRACVKAALERIAAMAGAMAGLL